MSSLLQYTKSYIITNNFEFYLCIIVCFLCITTTIIVVMLLLFSLLPLLLLILCSYSSDSKHCSRRWIRAWRQLWHLQVPWLRVKCIPPWPVFPHQRHPASSTLARHIRKHTQSASGFSSGWTDRSSAPEAQSDHNLQNWRSPPDQRENSPQSP